MRAQYKNNNARMHGNWNETGQTDRRQSPAVRVRVLTDDDDTHTATQAAAPRAIVPANRIEILSDFCARPDRTRCCE